MRNRILGTLCALLLAIHLTPALASDDEMSAYLFTYFTGNRIDEEAIRYAVSLDGYTYWALNNNQPVIDSKAISQTGGVRDPHILRAQDGKTFYMVATDMVSDNGWDSNRAMVLLRSDDLIHWTHANINIQERYEGQEDLKRVWAPQTIYDAEAGRYMVYWSMKHGQNGTDIIYYAYTNDTFTDLVGEPKPLFLPKDGKSCIDGDIVLKDGVYHLFYKTEGHGNGIRVATTRSLTSGQWTEAPDYKQQTQEAVEGAGTFKLIGQDKYILMYDVYIKGGYQFTETTDLEHFTVVDNEVQMNFHPRHGTIIPITSAELQRLYDAYGKPDALSLDDQELTLTGPDGRLQLTLACSANGKVTYAISYDDQPMLLPSAIGMDTNAGKYGHWLRLTTHDTLAIDQTYTLNRAKTSSVHYQANELTAHFENAFGQPIILTFRVSNNDVAFRYTLPKHGETGSVRVLTEHTAYAFPQQTTTFLCPQSSAMIGWKRTKPSYEEEYETDAPMDQRSRYGQGYTFPCLFRVGDNGYVLLSETGVDSHYCGSHLSDYADGAYHIAFPMPAENNGNGTVEPAFALPGSTPWRTITVGADLKPIAETTVPWDVVEPLYPTRHDYQFGKGTWSWILWQDQSINYDDQVKFVDLAATMGFRYTLIDNFWDTRIGRERIKELADYARARGVELFLWYSSSGYWNDIQQGPINLMDNPIARKREMKWLEEIGVKGIKVDFFGGDKQETMRLYEAILSDADDHGLMVIFHGCTLPRGWERMYPNYVGSEAVLASENLVFQQHFCDQEARNAALHPFVRNAVGCMEFGGTFLNHRLNRGNDGGTQRRTTDAFELATAILFQNPIQNFALAPNNLDDAPPVCLDFLRQVPTTWDETRLIDGYPGQYIVLARRHADTWYVAAINARTEALTLTIQLPMLQPGQNVNAYTDAQDLTPQLQNLKLKKDGTLRLTLQPQGGAVITNQ